MGHEGQVKEERYPFESGVISDPSFSLLLISLISIMLPLHRQFVGILAKLIVIINNHMHSSDSIFTGIKIIDYRNGRYQGYFNSQTEKRHGMGILVDDDMNVYCSEWEDGKMSGLTFIYMSNGSYIYGLWRNNEPHGINLYRNK